LPEDDAIRRSRLIFFCFLVCFAQTALKTLVHKTQWLQPAAMPLFEANRDWRHPSEYLSLSWIIEGLASFLVAAVGGAVGERQEMLLEMLQHMHMAFCYFNPDTWAFHCYCQHQKHLTPQNKQRNAHTQPEGARSSGPEQTHTHIT